MLVHVWVVAGRHKLHRWRDVGVAAGETQGQLVFESDVSLSEQRERVLIRYMKPRPTMGLSVFSVTYSALSSCHCPEPVEYVITVWKGRHGLVS